MTAHLYGWADLDAANRKHYERRGRKPRELIQAEDDLMLANDRLDKACDAYYDLHYGEPEYEQRMKDLQCEVIALEQAYQELKAKYSQGPELSDYYLEMRFDNPTDIN